MNYKNIDFDYDGVLFTDFENIFLNEISKKTGLNINIENSHLFSEQIKEETLKIINKEYDDKNITFFEKLYSQSGIEKKALDVLKTLKEENFNIRIITSSMSGQKEPKLKHIKEHIINQIDFDIEVISARKKEKYTKGRILIDDSFKNITNHINTNQDIGILFNLNLNKTNNFGDSNVNKDLLIQCNSFDSLKDTLLEKYLKNSISISI